MPPFTFHSYVFGATLISYGNAAAKLELFQDRDANTILAANELIAVSSHLGSVQERIAGTLRGGMYYLRVGGESLATPVQYLLRLSASAIADPGFGFAIAYNIGAFNPAATTILGGTLIDTDKRDYYRFTLSASTTVSLKLKSLSGNADLQLIHDANNNGILDPGEILATSAKTSGLDTITRTLGPGTYYLRVARASTAGSADDLTIDA